MTLPRKELMRMTDAQISEELRRRAKPQCGSMGNIYHPDEALLREAASRLQAPAVAEVEVKPMEWGSYGADTPFGSYTVSENFDDKWEWTFHCYPYGSPDDTVYDTEAEARQAAQADYERRIRSALRTGGSE